MCTNNTCKKEIIVFNVYSQNLILMKYREFGKTNLKVSEIGMGCWAIGGNEFGNSYGSTDDENSIKSINL